MGLSFTSCVKDVDPNSYENTKEQVLTDNFNTAFGVTEAEYANHRWGMNTVPLVVVNSSSSMRAAYPNGNLWEDEGYVVPADITAEERAKVLKVFNEVGAEEYESLIDWDCFFVQQVYKGVAEYTAGNGAKVVGSEHMDFLCTETNKKEEVICWWPKETEIKIVAPYADHIFDFNNSNSEDYGGRMLMVNSNTNRFGFQSSEDSQIHYYFRMEEIDGNYYVGLDFAAEGQNPNQQVPRDYIYNDWIVKVVPGKGTPAPRVRVMAEDLGTMSSDFDYNDIVFDILFVKDGDQYIADILLQAAGGTLPLYIGEGEGNTYEVHALFDVTTDMMVNTHAEDLGLKGRSGLVAVPFTVNLPKGKEYASMNAEDAVDALNIRVKIGDNIVRLRPTHSTGHDGVEVSKAPKLIVAPVGTAWASERVRIDKVYSKFVDWIKDSTIEWWVK